MRAVFARGGYQEIHLAEAGIFYIRRFKGNGNRTRIAENDVGKSGKGRIACNLLQKADGLSVN